MPIDWLSRLRLLMSVLGMYGLLLLLVHGLPFRLMGKFPGSAFAARKRWANRLLCWAGSSHCLPLRDCTTVGHLLQRQYRSLHIGPHFPSSLLCTCDWNLCPSLIALVAMTFVQVHAQGGDGEGGGGGRGRGGRQLVDLGAVQVVHLCMSQMKEQ